MSMRRSIQVASAFVGDRRGTTAVIFGVAAIPLTIAIGAAVDYSSAANRRVALQMAVDTAVIRGCKDIQTESVATATTNMQNVFNGSFKYTATFTPEVTTTVASGKVKANAASVVDAQLGALVGLKDIPIHATSECEYGNNTYEIALVMDNSGSMGESAGGGQSKMEASKAAAKELVNELYGGPLSAQRIKMSVVPFTLSVNVGSQYRNAAWVDTGAQSSIHWNNFNYAHSPWKPANRFTLFDEMNIDFGGCFEMRPGDYAVYPGNVPTGPGITPPPAADAAFVPQFAPDDPGSRQSGGAWYSFQQNGNGAWVSYYYENSYLGDRTGGGGGGVCNSDGHAQEQVDKALTKLCKYRGNPPKTISNGRGPNYMCNGQPLMRMTNEKATINSKIDTMVAGGNTNIFDGFMWGWRTISPDGPFADGRPNGAQPAGQPVNNKVIVLLTDGINFWGSLDNSNGSRFSPAGFLKNTVTDQTLPQQTFKKVSRFSPLPTNNEAQGVDAMDTRLKTACENAKAIGVDIYTIGFARNRNEVDEAVLTACASTNKKTNKVQYYYASDANQVKQVFKDIAQNLSELRLTK